MTRKPLNSCSPGAFRVVISVHCLKARAALAVIGALGEVLIICLGLFQLPLARPASLLP